MSVAHQLLAFGRSEPVTNRVHQIATSSQTERSERTGDAELDALIEQFTTTSHTWTTNLELFRDPDRAELMCDLLSEKFAAFLEQHGIEAWATEDGTPENWGYHDRSIEGFSRHMVTAVDHNGHGYTIDWTAAQYGYTEFPLVQRLREDWEDLLDRWERCWESVL